MEQKEEKLLDHEYDGIKELDNPLPSWWLAIFYGAIVFALCYFPYYHLGGPGKNPREALVDDLAAVRNMALTATANVIPLSAEDFDKALKSPAALEAGRQVFATRCFPCHGQKAEGLIGPNLTDNYWIHGDGSMPSIAQTVTNGVLDKGMPTWGPILKQEEILNVVAFVKSLKGSNPPNAKPPQGNLVKD